MEARPFVELELSNCHGDAMPPFSLGVRVGEDVPVQPTLQIAKHLQVTVWNVLAQVWVEASLYPCIDEHIYAAEARRQVLQRRMIELKSDIFLLNEVEERELHVLLHDGAAPLHRFYDSHFVVYPESMWSQVGVESVPWGVAILWRRGVLEELDLECSSVALSGGAPPVAFLRGNVVAWGKRVLIATAHLDGDGCPPSVTRSQKQLLEVADALVANARGCAATVWGGDCNLTPSAPAFKKLHSLGFQVASGLPHMPTALPVVGGARLDHIFVSGPLIAASTAIPSCSDFHCCPLAPCNFGPGMHFSQLLLDLLGLSSPKVPGFGRRIIGCFLLLPWFCMFACGFILPLRCSWQRCRSALLEWGSDHLPVTVQFCERGAM